MDYIQSLFELNYIAGAMDLNEKTVLEIGGGYGRTCHAIVSNYNVRLYCIVDLEYSLKLSRRYLKKVLTKQQFAKMVFISNQAIPMVEDRAFDLCINIDSMAEMDERVVLNYLDFIAKRSKYFYVKNPVGKYSDKSLDNLARGHIAAARALRTGILREVLDINDNRAVALHAKKFVRAYRPGNEWQCVSESWARPWSYYWQAIYKKKR